MEEIIVKNPSSSSQVVGKKKPRVRGNRKNSRKVPLLRQTTGGAVKKGLLGDKKQSKNSRPRKIKAVAKDVVVINTEAQKFVSQIQSLGASVNSSSAADSLTDIIPPNVNNNMEVVVPMSGNSILGFCSGVLAFAYTKGYREYILANNHPYYGYNALVGLFNLLANVVQGAYNDVPKIEVPQFLNDVCAALAAKNNIRLPNGKLSYSWKTNTMTPPNAMAFAFPANLNSGYRFYTSFTVNTEDSSGYFIQDTSSPPTPDDELALESLQDLFRYMTKISFVGWNPWKLVTLDATKSPLARSASAFAFGSKVLGGGWQGGYYNSLCSSETFIRHPKFAVWADNVSNSRAFHYHHPTGGDSLFLVGSIMTQKNEEEYKNPSYPIFKPVDFWEFPHRLFLAIARAFQFLWSDQATSNTNKLANIGLSGQDAVVVLYHEMMKNFGNTQWMVQSMYPYGGPSSGPDIFVPFIVSSNTAPSNLGFSLTLPLFMAENLYALRSRVVYPRFNPKTGKTNMNAPSHYYTVLGEYTRSTIDFTQYTYFNGTSNVSIFTDTTAMSISLVDGTRSSVPLDLSTSSKITDDKSIWNASMTELSPFIQKPTVIRPDSGVNILAMAGDSVIIQQAPEANTKKVETKGKDNKRNSLEKKKVTVTVYEKKYQYMSFQTVPIAEVVNIKQFMIMPEFIIFSQQTGTGNIGIDTVRSLCYELYGMPLGQLFPNNTDGTFVAATEVWKTAISFMVKGRNADNHLIVTQLDKLSEWGKAGLLADLVGDFGGPIANMAVKSLSNLIPF